MLLVPVLLGMAFQPCAAYTGPTDGTIHACSHAYRLICTRSGAPTDCTGTQAFGPAVVDRFQILDETGHVIFERSSLGQELFTGIVSAEMGYPGSELFMVGVSVTDKRKGRSSSRSYSYDFAVTPAGLELFSPATDCGEGEGRLLSNPGISRGCEFNTGYFRFIATLTYDSAHRQIELQPKPSGFPVFFADGGQPPQSTAVRSTQIRGYSDHDQLAPSSTEVVRQGQLIGLRAAWSPISLDTSAGIAVVRYDPGDLWLQIELNGRTSWIRGDRDFQAIGLRRDLR